MELQKVTYQGPSLDDPEMLDQVPSSLRSLLISINGFIQFGGGLHVRGACSSPDWHSLRRAWYGPKSFHSLFPAVGRHWIPFAEDCVGDQFRLNDTEVLRLSAETGHIEEMRLSLSGFLKRANSDPIDFLAMQPLMQIWNDQGDLPDGYLIHAYPPFCTQEAADGVSLKAVPAWELHQHHSELAAELPENGEKLHIAIID